MLNLYTTNPLATKYKRNFECDFLQVVGLYLLDSEESHSALVTAIAVLGRSSTSFLSCL
jgi:hypothetical protein